MTEIKIQINSSPKDEFVQSVVKTIEALMDCICAESVVTSKEV